MDHATATQCFPLIVTRAQREFSEERLLSRRMCEVTIIVNAETPQTEEGKLLSY